MQKSTAYSKNAALLFTYFYLLKCIILFIYSQLLYQYLFHCLCILTPKQNYTQL